MCEEGHDEILTKLNSLTEQVQTMDQHVASIDHRMITLESVQTHINKRIMDEDFMATFRAAQELREFFSNEDFTSIFDNGFKDVKQVVETLEKIVMGDKAANHLGLASIIYGSEELGVEPLRTTLKRLATAYDRIVWLAGIMGITTITGLIGWILFFLNRTPVP